MAEKTEGNSSKSKTSTQKAQSTKAASAKQIEKMKETQLDIFRKKTQQEMINIAYKAADKLGIAPWILIRAAGWGHFTQDRGTLYKGEHIVDIETLTDEQKEALMDVMGMKSGWEKIKKVQ